MAQQTIGLGTVANDGTGDTLRDAGQKINANFTELYTDKAPVDSPTLTGTPAGPTAAPGTNTTQIATTAFVKAAIDALLDGAPGALDTLNELAAAVNDDASFAATITAALAAKAPSASPNLTGTPTAPTAAAGTSTTQIASTAFVAGAVAAASGISRGTSFPGSPNAGDRFTRTDRKLDYEYDGSRWLSVDLHEMAIPISNSAASVDTTVYAPVPFCGSSGPVHGGVWLERIDGTMFRTAGSAEWDITLSWISGANVVTSITSLDGAGTTTNNWSAHSQSIGSVLDASARALEIKLDEISGTAGCYGVALIHYRLIG